MVLKHRESAGGEKVYIRVCEGVDISKQSQGGQESHTLRRVWIASVVAYCRVLSASTPRLLKVGTFLRM